VGIAHHLNTRMSFHDLLMHGSHGFESPRWRAMPALQPGRDRAGCISCITNDNEYMEQNYGSRLKIWLVAAGMVLVAAGMVR
jgi:hypothetical protein